MEGRKVELKHEITCVELEVTENKLIFLLDDANQI